MAMTKISQEHFSIGLQIEQKKPQKWHLKFPSELYPTCTDTVQNRAKFFKFYI